ncbi:MAG: hypothetical protein HKO59_05530, partial [Phycisphaerales bacterium]|nr:hypothetical protein [Phycisphaerales bacterium]
MAVRVQRALAGLLLLAAAGNADARPLFCEGIDAGSLPTTATTVSGAGTVTGIEGSLSSSLTGGGDFEDMYLISITDTVIFEARTVEPKTLPTFNTQLWLFSAASSPRSGTEGFGLLANDDAQPGGPGFPGSSLLLPMSDDGTGVVLTPGEYYLAITGFANQPLSEGPGGLQPIFEFDSPVEISGPDGPGGMHPIVGWSGGGETGAYLILLSGVTFL